MQRGKSGKRKKANEGRTRTSCGVQAEGQVSIAEESQQARGTHVLSSANERACHDRDSKSVSESTHSLSSTDAGTNQYKDLKSASQWHLLTVEPKQREKSGQLKEASEQVRCTHQL